MSTLNPMFEKFKPVKVDMKPQRRQQRSDKKLQVIVPVTSSQKLEIARLSFSKGHSGEFHSFLADVYKLSVERDFIRHAKDKKYIETGIYVSTRVHRNVYEKLIELKVEWGLRSVKQAAHRILMNELQL
ncbi:hypothetical protein K7887_18280 [Sutcliffiella horikoshii]|uniref:hypothetical protein n=1 Tax=Sutcliffiella horikoshii TaxID=79883 RepID=UPI001CBFF8C8|nr:hypothetical protein [Sutcliffiella horikoshii]UAL46792.1 hypothetical protein K7887_18280 [Sutcliffiella horikoshii]